MSLAPERFILTNLRFAIDYVDDGLIVLLAARRRLVREVATMKSRVGLPTRNASREHKVHARARSLAQRLDLPTGLAARVMDLVIDDACRQQDILLDPDQDMLVPIQAMMAPTMINPFQNQSLVPRLLRLLPPPQVAGSLLRVLPVRAQRALLEAAMARVLDVPRRDGALDFMRGRRLAIEVSDLRLRWVLELDGDRLRVVDAEPEASVRGSATDLLLLAGRLEDADTLFFQRALDLTGDTELGLTARNLLERLPWESVPLGLRIALNRGARFARAARSAHRGEFA